MSRPRLKITAAEHLAHPLRVHALLNDFELEDVWCLPVTLTSAQSLHLFLDQFSKSHDKSLPGVAGLLFKFRMWLGKVFKWDEKQLRDKLIPGTIRHRYAEQEGFAFEQLMEPGSGNFIPVYLLESEFLAEIENKTVHGALHISRVPINENVWGIHLAIYLKPKGTLGRLYLKLIKPFRLWIVYPTMLKTAKAKWEA
jgi:hypothetical protein